MTDISASPKLARLDADIGAECDPSKRACLKAERAGFLARQGHFEHARSELDTLQKEFARIPNAEVSIWMQIASGWMAHYNDQPTVARDHLQRAYALSTAASLNDLRALSAAWLAHLAYSQNDFARMKINVKVALQVTRKDFHPAQTRLNMVVALSYHFARRLDLAIPWYKKCRAHALAEGDDGSISALNFNMAALQANHSIQASVFGGEVGKYSGPAISGAASVHSFDQLVKTSSRTSWVYMIMAYSYSAENKYNDAVKLYEAHLVDACAQGMQHQRAFFVADLAWCKLNLGQDAEQSAYEAISLISDDMYVEDRAIARGRLGQVFAALGHENISQEYSDLARQDWNEHERSRSQLLEILDELNR